MGSTSPQSSIEKENGTLGFCVSLVFSRFHSVQHLQELNRKATEIKALLEAINQPLVIFEDIEGAEQALKLLEEICEAIPSVEDLTDGTDHYKDAQSDLKQTVQKLKDENSWTYLRSAIKRIKDGRQQGASSNSSNAIPENGEPHQVTENDDPNFISFNMDNLKQLEKLIKKFAKRLLPYRRGASKDIGKIKKTFDNLSFDTTPAFTDDDIASKDDLQNKLKLCISRPLAEGEEKHKFFVLVISSHGGWNEDKEQSYICLGDGQSFTVNDIYDIIEKSPLLTDIPKIIFIQACRGELIDDGKEVGDVKSTNIPVGEANVEKEAQGTKRIVIPSHSNFIIHYATVPGYMCWRDPHTGSVFITTLCEELEKKVKTTQLNKILLDVNEEVSKKNPRGRYKQMPCLVSTSLGDFYLLRDEDKPVNKEVEGTNGGNIRMADSAAKTDTREPMSVLETLSYLWRHD